MSLEWLPSRQTSASHVHFFQQSIHIHKSNFLQHSHCPITETLMLLMLCPEILLRSCDSIILILAFLIIFIAVALPHVPMCHVWLVLEWWSLTIEGNFVWM